MANLIVCCDGTNNQIKEDYTNVARLRRILQVKPGEQLVYYDPGVGTSAHPGLAMPFSRKISKVLGLAIGLGFTANLEEAYTFLMQNYRAGDRIYLFGFSRGAFTVRALAGMLYWCGLLHKDNQNLVPYASRLYTRKRFAAARVFRKSFSAQEVDVFFLGVWDTVSSIGFALDRTFLSTRSNPSVQRVRHGLAIDERRCFYRPNRWSEAPLEGQEVKQIWFAGVHSDVGGGYPDKEGGLSKVALEWMLEEAIEASKSTSNSNSKSKSKSKSESESESNSPSDEDPNGGSPVPLLIRADQRERVLPKKTSSKYSAPDPLGIAHRSLRGPWVPFELIPKRDWDSKKLYLPLGRRRTIPITDEVHPSVLQRVGDENLDYCPSNLRAWLEANDRRVPEKTSPSNEASLGERVSGVLWTALVLGLAVFLGGFGLAFLDQTVEASLGERDFDPIGMTARSSSWFLHLRGLETLLSAAAGLLPFLVFLVGSRQLQHSSGMSRFELKVKSAGRLPHLRLIPLGPKGLEQVLSELGDKASQAYAKSLRLDYWFLLAYGASFLVSFAVMKLYLEVPLAGWTFLLPIGTALADGIENGLLLSSLDRVGKGQPLSRVTVYVAGAATTLKFIGFLGSSILTLRLMAFLVD